MIGSDSCPQPENGASLQLEYRLMIPPILCYVLFAVVSQVKSSVLPWKDRSPIEYFTTTLFWMLSLTCPQITQKNLDAKGGELFGLTSCAALAILAMYEIFFYHENTKGLVGDGEYIKIVFCLMAGGILCFVSHLAAAPSPASFST